MNFTVTIDCTPEEARRMVGLPDLSAIHETYLTKMRQAVEQGVTVDTVSSVMQAWAPMGESGLGLWRQMLEQMGTARS